jgi:N-methylhydantoinase B
VVPERVIAANSHFFNPMVGGSDPRTGKPFILWEVIVGGIGARHAKDGIEATASPYNTTNVPVELQELHNPVIIERVELVQDSAGAGRFRGGSAMRKDLRVLADNASFYNVGDRAKFQPYGLFGGKAGALGSTVLNPGSNDERELSSKGTYRLRAGDVISWRTAGAGGSSDPMEREPQAVLDDVLDGFVSVAAAASLYGVALCGSPLRVDPIETARLRQGSDRPAQAAGARAASS